MKIWNITLNLFLLLIIGCSKSEPISGDHGTILALENRIFFESVGEVKPYNINTPYAAIMKECIYADTAEKSCTVGSLPFIGMSKDKITVQDILDRTMISHEFLGERFKQVLLRLNPEILQMFGAVASVVISDAINPSFYLYSSGTIYLDGNYFWKTEEEWDLLSQTEDSRDGMGLPLQFKFDSDYIKNGKSIINRAQANSQTYNEIVISISKLLFHELTHANDYFPSVFYKSQDLNLNKTYQKMGHERFLKSKLMSDQQTTFLNSSKLKHISQILYKGVSATPADSLILAEDIIQEFKNDIANDVYAYVNSREDFAMCAEEALMLYYYNIPKYTAIIRLPGPYFVEPKNYIYQIAWGEKSRVLKPHIKNRAIFAIESVLGKIIGKKVSKRFDEMAPKEIPENISRDNLHKF